MTRRSQVFNHAEMYHQDGCSSVNGCCFELFENNVNRQGQLVMTEGLLPALWCASKHMGRHQQEVFQIFSPDAHFVGDLLLGDNFEGLWIQLSIASWLDVRVDDLAELD